MRTSNDQQAKWLFCVGVSLCALLITYWPDGLLIFRYDRAAILSGQVWRIMTGHLAHLNTPHLALNVIGLFLLTELLWGKLPVLHAVGLLMAANVGVSILLLRLHPELSNYAGLSGALHGLWAGAALAGLTSNLPCKRLSDAEPFEVNLVVNRYASFAGLLLLLVKLVLECRNGASIRTEQLIGAPIVISAHLYGALIGAAYVLIWRIATLLNRQDDV